MAPGNLRLGGRLNQILCKALGIVLILASFSKVGDLESFRQVLAHSRLIPARAVGLLSIAVPSAELAVGSLMVLEVCAIEACLLSTCLFLGFLGYSAALNALHVDSPCGCLNLSIPSGKYNIPGWAHIGANGILLALSAYLLFSVLRTARNAGSLGRPGEGRSSVAERDAAGACANGPVRSYPAGGRRRMAQ